MGMGGYLLHLFVSEVIEYGYKGYAAVMTQSAMPGAAWPFPFFIHNDLLLKF